MKKKLILLLLMAALAQPAAMPSHITTEAATTGYEKKANLLNTTQCIVLEPNYKTDNSQHIQPGNSFKKDPYVKSEARYDAYCFARVEIPKREGNKGCTAKRNQHSGKKRERAV